MEKVLNKKDVLHEELVSGLFGKRMSIDEIKKYLILNFGVYSVKYITKKSIIRVNIMDNKSNEYVIEIWIENKDKENKFLITMIHTREKEIDDRIKKYNQRMKRIIKNKEKRRYVNTEVELFGVNIGLQKKLEITSTCTEVEKKVFEFMLKNKRDNFTGRELKKEFNFSEVRAINVKNSIERKVLMTTNYYKKEIKKFYKKLNKIESECIRLYENNELKGHKRIASKFGISLTLLKRLFNLYENEKNRIIDEIKGNVEPIYEFGSIRETFSKEELDKVIRYMFNYKGEPFKVFYNGYNIFLHERSNNGWIYYSHFHSDKVKIIHDKMRDNKLREVLNYSVNRNTVKNILIQLKK